MTNEDNLENKIEEEKPSLYDFTRKSVVGAGYRVGASFTMDAVYLSLIAGAYYVSEDGNSLENMAKGFSDFIASLDPWKLLRVAGFVVGINFVDYKFDVTNKLDNLTKKAEKGLSRILGMKKQEEFKGFEKKMHNPEESPEYVLQVLNSCNQKEIKELFPNDSSDRTGYYIKKVLGDKYAVLTKHPEHYGEDPTIEAIDSVYYIDDIPRSNMLKENIGKFVKLYRDGFWMYCERTA